MRIATLLVCVLALAACTGDDDSGGRGAESPAIDKDHWHAALAVDICGEWLVDAPEFHNRLNEVTAAGIHSHGDGLVHVHPFARDEAIVLAFLPADAPIGAPPTTTTFADD